MDSLAITNQKGGVGKTALTVNLGGALAEDGRRVLLVDLDPQGHLTEALGLGETTEPATLAAAMLGTWTGDARELVTSYRPLLDVIPTNVDAFLLEQRLYQERGREHRLARVLEQLADAYDVALIDCPPSLGSLTDNALVAARRALVPTQSEDTALRALRLLLSQVESVEIGLQLQVELVGMVVNGYDRRRGQVVTSTMAVLEQLPLPVLGVIGDRAAVREVWRYRAPVTEHAPESDAAEAYRALVKAIPWNGGER